MNENEEKKQLDDETVSDVTGGCIGAFPSKQGNSVDGVIAAKDDEVLWGKKDGKKRLFCRKNPQCDSYSKKSAAIN